MQLLTHNKRYKVTGTYIAKHKLTTSLKMHNAVFLILQATYVYHLRLSNRLCSCRFASTKSLKSGGCVFISAIAYSMLARILVHTRTRMRAMPMYMLRIRAPERFVL